MPPEAVVSTLRHIWAALDAAKAPAALAGGLAMSAWGRPRFTKDVDLLIGVGEELLRDIRQRLRSAGIRTEKPIVRVGENKFIQMFYQVPDSLLEIQIDLILATTDFHHQAIERRVPLLPSVLGFDAQVVRCEDLIILKLIADRILDRVDAGELLQLNRESLDLNHLAHWVSKLGLIRQFRQAWNDVLSTEPPPI